MKTIGLLGGLSWESSKEYYNIINKTVYDRLGGQNNARSVMVSVNFQDIENDMFAGKWDIVSKELITAAKGIERAGADMLLICSNTMHKLANDVRESISIPLIHIGEVTANAVTKDDLRTVGLLGTKFTMEEQFYTGPFRDNNIAIIVPDEQDRNLINDIIFNELCHGIIKDESKRVFKRIIECLHAKGAEGVILGCTEIPLLIEQKDSPIPVYDTTRIHALAAVDESLSKNT